MDKNAWSKLGGFMLAIGGVGIGIITAAKKVGKRMESEMTEAAPADMNYRDKTKRLIDLVIAIPTTIVFAIPMAITATAIKLDSPGPVFFKQERIGMNGKIFEIWKFRSMCQNAEKTGSGVYSGKGDSRVTRVGKFIRATSIDELP